MNPALLDAAAKARLLWAERVKKLTPAIEAELEPLDRAGLVERLAREGYQTTTVSGVRHALVDLGEAALPASDLRSMVFDVLLLRLP